MSIIDKHAILEKSPSLLLAFSLFVVTIGGIVEIAPLFWLQNTIEDVEGMRPYSPLELTGRDIYIREGCYVCHSQMIRPMRDEVAMAITRWRPKANMTIRFNGGPNAPVPTWRGSAGAIPMNGTLRI